MLALKGLLNEGECRRREYEWHQAALATPHGQPVVLSRALQDRETVPGTSRTVSESSR
jgi:hypothetical protein